MKLRDVEGRPFIKANIVSLWMPETCYFPNQIFKPRLMCVGTTTVYIIEPTFWYVNSVENRTRPNSGTSVDRKNENE